MLVVVIVVVISEYWFMADQMPLYNRSISVRRRRIRVISAIFRGWLCMSASLDRTPSGSCSEKRSDITPKSCEGTPRGTRTLAVILHCDTPIEKRRTISSKGLKWEEEYLQCYY